MHGDDWRSVTREELVDRILPRKPIAALARAVEINHHPRDKRLRKPEDQCAAMLQNLATIRDDSVGHGSFVCSPDR